MVEILIKRTTKKIKLPVYKTTGSAGMDIEANIENDIIINPGEKKLIPTGISVAIPASVGFNIFQYRVEILAQKFDRFSDILRNRLENELVKEHEPSSDIESF